MFDSSLPPVVCMRDHVLFNLFVFVCAKWCLTHILLCFCVVCLHLLYPMLPVYLDCPFLIAPAVFSDVYLLSRLSYLQGTLVTAKMCSFLCSTYIVFDQ